MQVAMTLDGNGRWCAQDPREGSKALVAEACRNLACAGAEMTFGEGSVGAEVTIPSGQVERGEEALFGEGAGRILVEVEESAVGEVERLAMEAGVGFQRIGGTGGKELKVNCGDVQAKWTVEELKAYFESALPNALK